MRNGLDEIRNDMPFDGTARPEEDLGQVGRPVPGGPIQGGVASGFPPAGYPPAQGATVYPVGQPGTVYPVSFPQGGFAPAPGVYPGAMPSPYPPVPQGGGYPADLMTEPVAAPPITRPIRVVLADTDPGVIDTLPTISQSYPDIWISCVATDGQQCLDDIADYHKDYDVVVVNVDLPLKDGISLTREIRQRWSIPVVITMSAGDPRFPMANQAGAAEILIRPFNLASFAECVRKAYQRGVALRQQEALRRQMATNLQPAGQREGPAEALGSAGTVAVQKQKVISVYSPKGGSGVSFIAANLACLIAAKSQLLTTAEDEKLKVALVDFDFAYNDLDVILAIPSGKSLYDVYQAFDPKTETFTDEAILKKVAFRHETGVDVFCGPLRLEQTEYFEGKHVRAMIDMLKKHYDIIIIDTTTDLRDTTLTALEMSDLILFVVTPEIACIRDAQRVIETLNSLGYSMNKLGLVMNKISQASQISVREIPENLKMPKWAIIPEDKFYVEKSIVESKPVAFDNSANPVGQALMQIAASPKVCPALLRFLRPAVQKKTSFFGSVFGGLKKSSGGSAPNPAPKKKLAKKRRGTNKGGKK